MISPSQRLVTLTAAWLVLAAVASAFPSMILVWWIAGIAMLAVTMVDGVLILMLKPAKVARKLPGRFALGEEGEVRLALRNEGPGRLKIEVFDGIPPDSEAAAMPWRGEIPARREIKVFHRVRPNRRGELIFGPVQVRRISPIGLWTVRSFHLQPETVKVYPNYEPVVRYALLAMQHRESPMGIVRRPRPGSSRDFHQLRDYRDGDPFSQIDWKATSRRQVLISRDYQEQRDQSVVFLLDTGRRMRALDGGAPQFDHVLNAILLVAHVALRQGDQISVKSFGGTNRWLPPIKGAHAMPVLLNHLYDYQTTSAPSDFADAVEKLMAKQRRRSLVILLTNLRGEDGKELLPALQVLQTRHLVLLASMREEVVRGAFETPVQSFATALRYLAAGRYVQERREILASLAAAGVLTLDSSASEFPAALANCYFDIKAAGRL